MAFSDSYVLLVFVLGVGVVKGRVVGGVGWLVVLLGEVSGGRECFSLVRAYGVLRMAYVDIEGKEGLG